MVLLVLIPTLFTVLCKLLLGGYILMKSIIDVSFSLLLSLYIFHICWVKLIPSKFKSDPGFPEAIPVACLAQLPLPFLPHPSKREGSFTVFGVTMVACDAFCPKCCCHHQRLMFPWQPGEVSRHELNAGKELWSEKLYIWNFWFQLFPLPSQLLYSISRTDCSQDVFLIERPLWGEADQLIQVMGRWRQEKIWSKITFKSWMKKKKSWMSFLGFPRSSLKSP